MPELLTAAEVAQLLRLAPDTVRGLARSGILPRTQLRPRGRILFEAAAVRKVLRERTTSLSGPVPA
jgi:hypothetical protein